MTGSAQPRPVAAWRSDPGRVRRENEDWAEVSWASDESVSAEKGDLFVVADGMGGHAGGKGASRFAVQKLIHAYRHHPSGDVEESLRHALAQANAELYREAAIRVGDAGAGTTLVGLVIRDGHAVVVNVGDSRAYRVRGGRIQQITQDHSWVAEQQRAGRLTEQQAERHAMRSTITRAVGSDAQVKPDFFEYSVHPGDTFVLCTDGLTKHVSDARIRSVVTNYSPEEAADQLIQLARQRGGKDNVTVLIARVPSPPDSRRSALVQAVQTLGWGPALGGAGVLALVLVFLLAVAVLASRFGGTSSGAVPGSGAVGSPTTTPGPAVVSIPSPGPTAVQPTVTLKPLPGQRAATQEPATMPASRGVVIVDGLWVFPSPDATLSCTRSDFEKLPAGTEVQILEANQPGQRWCEWHDFCRTRSAPPFSRCSSDYHRVQAPHGVEGWVWSPGIRLDQQ